MNKKTMQEKMEIATKTIKDFMSIQKTFFGQVIKDYFKPLAVVFAFLGVFGEMFRQMFISLAMSSEDYEKYQQIKVIDEVEQMLAKEAAEKEEG